MAVAADGPRETVVVALGAVGPRSHPPGSAPSGDRPVTPSSLCMAYVLVGLAAEREPVRVVSVEGETVAGVVRAVGQDVATLHIGTGATAYVPLGAVAAIVVGE